MGRHQALSTPASCPGCGALDATFRFRIGRQATLPLFECPRCRLMFAPAPAADRERHDSSYHDARSHALDLGAGALSAAMMLEYWSKRLEWPSSAAILEVGCAEGTLLEVARTMGYGIRGIDVSAYYQARWRERQLPAAVATVEEYSEERANQFDVIIARQVFEHVRDPASFLAACAALLRSQGCCLIETCDSHSLQAKLLGRRWAFWEPMEGLGAHVTFLNRTAARRLGAPAGFRLTACVPYGRYRPPAEDATLRPAAAWRWLKYRLHRTALSGGMCYVLEKRTD